MHWQCSRHQCLDKLNRLPVDNEQKFPIIISHLPARDCAEKINTLRKILSADIPRGHLPQTLPRARPHCHLYYHTENHPMTNGMVIINPVKIKKLSLSS